MDKNDYWLLKYLLKEHISGGYDAETLRSVFATVEVPIRSKVDSKSVTKWNPTEKAMKDPLFRFRFRLLDMAYGAVARTIHFMTIIEDAWLFENKERWKKHLRIRKKDREIYDTLVAFMSATEAPVPGSVKLYESLRELCSNWIGKINEWYPDIV